MKYKIIKGEPTADELLAIQAVIAKHVRAELVPVIRKSAFGLPQLRRPLNSGFSFGRTN
ncbi:unannotated protein [freshwater metagenome]|uniref:Unannotated protein n=1 Tax=freshwater metagenome TaxID=449393 RepID=A0A6J7CSB8_9ZZZZ